jgi:protocatechuate 3,4-dioxygenase beta subunit
MRPRFAGATTFVLLAAALLPAQTPPTQSGAGPMIRGTVVTDNSGRPVRRATVSLVDGASGVTRSEMADDQGRFTFGVLPRAGFALQAAKLGYVTMYYGSEVPGRKPGATLELAAGQRELAVTIKMVHGAAISGRVQDSLGRPVSGARIEVIESRGPAASRLLIVTPTFNGQSYVSADAQGDYRFWGVPPGTFVVRATQIGSDGDPGRRITTPAEIQWALEQLRPGAFGTAAAATRPRAANAILTRSVYYPGAADVAGAVTLVLGAGQDRGGVDIVLPVKTIGGSH